MDWRAKNVRGRRPPRITCPSRRISYRRRLARRLEWQAAEDGDDSFQKHQRDGRRRRVCLDGRERASGRRLPGGHELQLVSHRQIPLGPANDGGGCHGALWHDGKLWIASLRLRGNLRVDPKTWEPEFMIPFYQAPDRVRYHGIAWDNGTIWQVVGNDSKRYSEYRPGLVRYEAATGKVLETVDFVPNSCDPHGLAMHDGKLISCDAGIHPGWPNNDSPTAGWIFQIDFI